MPVEIEVKMHVLDLEPVRAKLEELGAEHKGRREEVNTFVDTDDRALLAGDEGLRIRSHRDVSSGRMEYVMTYKGPRQAGVAKSRDEIEVTVDDADAAAMLLDRLGYHRTLTFEKRRESWALRGCSVELDELPKLGTFVEVEGPDEATVMQVRDELGLDSAPMEKRSYAALLADWLKQHAPGKTDVKF